MFDLVAKKTITVEGLDFSSDALAGTTDSFAVYYKSGTHVGFDSSATAWTLLGTVTLTAASGYTHIPLPLKVTIPAGQRAAFYMTYTNRGESIKYHNGTAVGNVTAEDANLQLIGGIGHRSLIAVAV